MDCPKCYGGTKVADSQPQVDSVTRRRRCLSCGYRFSTIEIDIDLYNRMSPPDREALRAAVDSHLLALKHSLYQIYKL